MAPYTARTNAKHFRDVHRPSGSAHLRRSRRGDARRWQFPAISTPYAQMDAIENSDPIFVGRCPGDEQVTDLGSTKS